MCGGGEGVTFHNNTNTLNDKNYQASYQKFGQRMKIKIKIKQKYDKKKHQWSY